MALWGHKDANRNLWAPPQFFGSTRSGTNGLESGGVAVYLRSLNWIDWIRRAEKALRPGLEKQCRIDNEAYQPPECQARVASDPMRCRVFFRLPRESGNTGREFCTDAGLR
jgi:hypothetical protein